MTDFRRFSIVFAADEAYTQHLGVALQSMLSSNQDSSFDVYIISGGISHQSADKLQIIASNFDCQLTHLVFKSSIFDDLATGSDHLTPAAFYRLMMPELIDVEKVIYLDSDLIVNGSINSLWNSLPNNSFLSAVEDAGFVSHNELNMDAGSRYFNSGVMVINLKKWREAGLGREVIKFIDTNPERITYADQCGLNAVINGKWTRLPPKYNLQTYMYKSDISPRFITEDLQKAKLYPVIVHYSGPSKPWHFTNRHPYKHLYYKALRKTPFRWFIPSDMTASNIIRKTKTNIRTVVNNYLTKPGNSDAKDSND